MTNQQGGLIGLGENLKATLDIARATVVTTIEEGWHHLQARLVHDTVTTLAGTSETDRPTDLTPKGTTIALLGTAVVGAFVLSQPKNREF